MEKEIADSLPIHYTSVRKVVTRSENEREWVKLRDNAVINLFESGRRVLSRRVTGEFQGAEELRCCKKMKK